MPRYIVGLMQHQAHNDKRPAAACKAQTQAGVWTIQAGAGSSTHIQGVLAQLFIEVPLLLRHLSVQYELLLAGQAVLHIALHTPQQEWLQNGMQLCDHLHQMTTASQALCLYVLPDDCLHTDSTASSHKQQQ